LMVVLITLVLFAWEARTQGSQAADVMAERRTL